MTDGWLPSGLMRRLMRVNPSSSSSGYPPLSSAVYPSVFSLVYPPLVTGDIDVPKRMPPKKMSPKRMSPRRR